MPFEAGFYMAYCEFHEAQSEKYATDENDLVLILKDLVETHGLDDHHIENVVFYKKTNFKVEVSRKMEIKS